MAVNRDDHIAQFRRSKKKNRTPRSDDAASPSPIQMVNDIDNYNDDAFDDDYEDEEEYENEEPWNDEPTPYDDDDYGENYDDVYDDAEYAAAPPNKKKYRESDANIRPLAYIDAKKAKDKQIRDKFERRYSKYEPVGHTVPDEKDIDDENISNGKRPSAIETSVTQEISNGMECSAATPTKEMSLYYNKKTQDKYDEFEMNTYDSSEDSESNSEKTMNKYLTDPLTPAPDTAYLKGDTKMKKPASETNGFNSDGLKLIKEKDSKSNKKPKSKKGKGKGKSKGKKKSTKKQQKAFNERQNMVKKPKKKKCTVKQFMKVNLKKFVKKFDGDNFDVAKAVCKHFDDLTEDTDTVTIVSDKGQGPNTAYWSKGDYNRVEKDCLGKYIMIYRACKHVQTTVKVNQDIFESCVKGLCMDNLGHSQLIADKLDAVFGEGCHVSLASHDDFEVFCRYSDGYICEVELPSGDFVVAWRR
eukprot:71121_1